MERERATTGLVRASEVFRRVEALEAQRISCQSSKQQRRVMLCAGGSGDDAEWVAVPTRWRRNEQFEVATRMSLGAAVLEAPRRFALTKRVRSVSG